MKNNYSEPILEVVKFSPEDVLASSEVAPNRSRGVFESEEIELD